MARSLKKGYFIDAHLRKKVDDARSSGSKKAIQTWSRRSTITPEAVGLNVSVHNGKTFTTVYVTDDMVGHKYGELAPTRTFRGHAVDSKKGK